MPLTEVITTERRISIEEEQSRIRKHPFAERVMKATEGELKALDAEIMQLDKERAQHVQQSKNAETRLHELRSEFAKKERDLAAFRFHVVRYPWDGTVDR